MSSLSNNNRLISIDAYRALIMLLMIFVNDTWTLINIPEWIEHLPAEADGLGLADIVFPAFLFIVGLSVPFAIQNRVKKGDSSLIIAGHIIIRALALIIMGVFYVNLDDYSTVAVLPKFLWQILITIAFFLIWLDYPNQKARSARNLRVIGILLLVLLAFLYKDNANTSGWISMNTHWWGILGMIGWCYLLVSGVFLVSKGNVWAQISAFVFFILFNMWAQSHLMEGWEGIKNYIWIVGDGALPAITVAGVIVSLLYTRMKDQKLSFVGLLVLISFGVLGLGLLARMEWNISKIWATPSFALVCTSISIVGFALMVYVVEIRKWSGWYRWISPAGTSTLTCYLLPYVHYALLAVIVWRLPEELRTGTVGILKSILYALIIIGITGFLEKRKIRLKL